MLIPPRILEGDIAKMGLQRVGRSEDVVQACWLTVHRRERAVHNGRSATDPLHSHVVRGDQPDLQPVGSASSARLHC
jgi:hypothetical protein